MADFGNPPTKKRKTRLGDPPLANEASSTLEAPEHAPATPEEKPNNVEVSTRAKNRGKTGRTITFGTRVSQDFDDEFRELAFRERMKHVELLEEMLRFYKKNKR